MPRQNGFFVNSKVNTFKKYEITKQQAASKNSINFQGQASFEYFVLFILLAFFCLWGLYRALPSAGASINGMFEEAVESITVYE